jgi:UDP-N-acetylglucosamine/UDP-N-acetylgalactosamine diphosphorylase
MIRVSSEAAQVLIAKVCEAGQGHVLDFWDELDAGEQNAILAALGEIDFQLLQHLVNRHLKGTTSQRLTIAEPEPIEVVALPRTPSERERWASWRQDGLASIAAGEVAVFMAAGSDGSAVGVAGPEGFCPVGPVSQKTLFALHAEKVVALNRRFHAQIPFLVMTSAETDESTRAFFTEHRYFTLPQGSVWFMRQPRLPLVDRRGRIVMSAKSEIAMAPNGHGGAFVLLRQDDVLARLRERGVRYVYYFQVDNPLVAVADPAMVGHHKAVGAEVSAKAIRKKSADEQVGVFAGRGQRLSVIEYSELSPTLRQKLDPETGELLFGWGNMATHLFSLDFIERTRGEEFVLPYHRADGRIQCLDRNGKRLQPSKPNCIRFESYIFDVFAWTASAAVLEADRREEFYPLRARHGECSPEAVRRALTEKYAAWLAAAGVSLPRGEGGGLVGSCEVSPLYAMDREELEEKLDAATMPVGDALYLE